MALMNYLFKILYALIVYESISRHRSINCVYCCDTLDGHWEWDSNGYVFFCLCMEFAFAHGMNGDEIYMTIALLGNQPILPLIDDTNTLQTPYEHYTFIKSIKETLFGRFGNQVEHLLGGMAFAKALNRTLVVPPWMTYKTVPFTDWFSPKPLQEYHKVILAEDFMKNLADVHWPKQERKGYCWVLPGSNHGCAMKTGFPFERFWGDQNISFVEDVPHQLDYDVDDLYIKEQWMKRFPPESHPVLAMRGAPARYPMKARHRPLQQFLKWSPWIRETAQQFITSKMRNEKFIGIHLRNEPSWRRDCSYAIGRSSFMASPQCLVSEKYGQIKIGLCDPPKTEVISKTISALKVTDARHLFIATDHDPMLEDFNSALKDLEVSVHHLNPERPQIDLAILGLADHFIGNCISSFTAFVKRERDINNLSSSFWSFP